MTRLVSSEPSVYIWCCSNSNTDHEKDNKRPTSSENETFVENSDDGSRTKDDDAMLVTNDKIHEMK